MRWRRLLVDKAVAEKFLPQMAQKLAEKKVELRCDAISLGLIQSAIGQQSSAIKAATEQDWFTEYNDLHSQCPRGGRREGGD